MLGLIPCAGTASRLFNLPKFMLPLKDKQMSLLSRWINMLIDIGCNKIVIGVSDTTEFYVNHILNTQFSVDKEKIHVKMVGTTETMNDTVLKTLENETYKLCIMGMPDTYVDKISPELIKKLTNNDNINVGTYLWNIRQSQVGKLGQCEINDEKILNIVDKNVNCNYEYGWGSIIFKPEFEKYIKKSQLHLGYSMVYSLYEKNKIIYEIIPGQYFDCGTIEGYTEYLNYTSPKKPIHIKGTIIVIAVHINNEPKNYDILVKCLKQIRTLYKNETVVIIDNKSLNTIWHNVASELNMVVLANESNIHRFEIGAYRLALEHFRADKYIFIQGTIYFKHRIELLLENDIPDAGAFSILKENNTYCSAEGLQFINHMLNSLGMDNWNNDPILLWNCFYCNNLFIEKIMDFGLFDMPCNTKNHSCAFERILGCYFNRNLKVFKSLGKGESEQSSFEKIFLRQDSYNL